MREPIAVVLARQDARRDYRLTVAQALWWGQRLPHLLSDRPTTGRAAIRGVLILAARTFRKTDGPAYREAVEAARAEGVPT